MVDGWVDGRTATALGPHSGVYLTPDLGPSPRAAPEMSSSPRGLDPAGVEGPEDQRDPLAPGGVSWTHLCSPLPETRASQLHAPLPGPLWEGK